MVKAKYVYSVCGVVHGHGARRLDAPYPIFCCNWVTSGIKGDMRKFMQALFQAIESNSPAGIFVEGKLTSSPLPNFGCAGR
jgi:hypothetical protein